MDNEPEQGALFEIEGPDDDSCVWLVSGVAGTASTGAGSGTRHRLRGCDRVAEEHSHVGNELTAERSETWVNLAGQIECGDSGAVPLMHTPLG
jgi:hypothetical protein